MFGNPRRDLIISANSYAPVSVAYRLPNAAVFRAKVIRLRISLVRSCSGVREAFLFTFTGFRLVSALLDSPLCYGFCCYLRLALLRLRALRESVQAQL